MPRTKKNPEGKQEIVTFRLTADEKRELDELGLGEAEGDTINARVKNLVVQKLKELRTLGKPLKLEEVQSAVAAGINRLLLESRNWVDDAVLDLQLQKNAESIFGERIKHYQREKERLAEQFIPLLLDRVHRILAGRRKVALVIDSGTTTYFAFRQLAQELVERCQRENSRFADLAIITNNLAGVDSYMTCSRLNQFTPNGRSASTTLSEFIACKVLTGRVLSKYAALTGIDTELALEKQKERLIAGGTTKHLDRAKEPSLGGVTQPGEPVFIGLVVGNWIRISDDGRHPIPLARDHEEHRHVEFKKKMIEICDELYVISPLGKLFVGKSFQEVQHGLGMVSRKDYRDVTIPPDKEKAMKLVSTSRSGGNLLSNHSRAVSTYGKRPDDEIRKRFIAETEIEKVPSLLFPFADLPENKSDQIPIEFPHEDTRTSPFVKGFFAVD